MSKSFGRQPKMKVGRNSDIPLYSAVPQVANLVGHSGMENVPWQDVRVLDGARVGEGALVAAGAVVPPGMAVPPRTLVVGTPARVRRSLTEAERAEVAEASDLYVGYAAQHARELGLP